MLQFLLIYGVVCQKDDCHYYIWFSKWCCFRFDWRWWLYSCCANVGDSLIKFIDVIIQLHATPYGKQVTEIYYPQTGEKLKLGEDNYNFEPNTNVIKSDFQRVN